MCIQSNLQLCATSGIAEIRNGGQTPTSSFSHVSNFFSHVETISGVIFEIIKSQFDILQDTSGLKYQNESYTFIICSVSQY